MTFRLTLAAASFALAMGLFSAAAQESTLRANIASVTDDTYPNARLVLNIEDDSAEGATLNTDNFSITVNGSDARVVSAELASSQDEPLDLTLVMDTSGSMAGAAMTNAKDAAKALVAELAPNDRVAVIRFSDQVVVVQDYTSDRGLVMAAIDGLVAEGNTALYQATTVAAFKAVSSAATRKAVVLLSDGADFGGASTATREEAIAAAGNVSVPYFAIAQGSDLDIPYLQEVANVTKGRLLEAVNPADLRSLYLSIGRILRNQYIVTFDATAAAPLPESTVAVRVTSGEREATDEASYRPAAGFAPPVDISGVEPGDEVTGARDILVNVGSVAADRVVFFVDGAQVAESATGPYVFTFDPANFGDGPHTIRVVVEIGGQPIEASVPFTSAIAAPPSDGGGLPIVPVAIGGMVLILGGAVGTAVFRGRHRGTDIGRLGVGQRTVPWVQQVAAARAVAPSMPLLHADDEPEVEPEPIGEPLGVLISRSGPDLGSEYSVGGAPVSIGSGARCGVRVDDPDMAAEEARIWVRGGHLMVHRMTRLSVVAEDGAPGGWVILEPGDTFTIGQHVFEFRMIDPDAYTDPVDASAANAGPVPNILRNANAPGEAGHFGEASERRFRLAEMMPSSEYAPSANADDDADA